MSATGNDALLLAKDLWKQVKASSSTTTSSSKEQSSIDVSLCQVLVQNLEKCIDKVPAFKMNVLVKTLTAAGKTFRLEKRGCKGDATAFKQWQGLLVSVERMLTTVQAKQANPTAGNDDDNDDTKASADEDNTAQKGLPSSTRVYLARLQKQRKELYKNPPALPPATITIENDSVGLPKRNQKTGELTFVAGPDKSTMDDLLKLFRPNRSPEQVLRGGAFGGTYYRSIASAVTNQTYSTKQVLSTSVQDEWIKGLDSKTMLTSQKYQQHVNKYKSKCGGSLGMWESSGWIADSDPYGWFQWYCRFYQGRRCSDDARQISRWKGVAGLKGRFKSQLCNKIIAANTSVDDTKISPVIRQTLWHWGLEITEDVLEKHKNRK